jgi:hypothetical protein
VTQRVIASSLTTMLLALLALPSLSFAQDRGFVSGQVGVAFQSETAPVFAGELGGNIVPSVAIYGTVGRIQDALPNDIQDFLDLISTGIDASLPTFYGMGGVRAGAPTGSIRPYGVFGVGIAHLSANIEYLDRDITALVEDEIGESLTSNELAFELGGGVMIPVASKGFVDAGFRYTRINGADINVSRVYGGFGMRF